jgi:hypothetical protein
MPLTTTATPLSVRTACRKGREAGRDARLPVTQWGQQTRRWRPLPRPLSRTQCGRGGLGHSAVKKPRILSTKDLAWGECLAPPSRSDSSNSRSSFFCFSVRRTGVSTRTWQ